MTDLIAPQLHVRPSAGWLNDPNGIGFWSGRWHVMFQWNPRAPVHENVHWGHLSSADLLVWREEPAALTPRPGMIDAVGAWSGVAVVDPAREDRGDPSVTLVYTASRGDAYDSGVAVAPAANAEGTMFAPSQRWVAPHPHGWRDVRDPFVFTVAGERFAIQGAGRLPRGGAVLVYRVPALDQPWELLGELASEEALGAELRVGAAPDSDIWECPQLVRVGEDWVLVVSWVADISPVDGPAGRSPRQGVTAYVGGLEIRDGVPRFVARSGSALDDGPDFYAPQLAVDETCDRILAWGWSWEGRGARGGSGAASGGLTGIDPSTNVTSSRETPLGWAGTLTFPRELVVEDVLGVPRARLVPARELAQLRGDPLEMVETEERGGVVRSDVPAFGARVGAGREWELALVGQAARRVVWGGSGATGETTVLVDGSIVEVFDGSGSHTRRAYARAGESWELRARGPADGPDAPAVAALEAWELRLPHSD